MRDVALGLASAFVLAAVLLMFVDKTVGDQLRPVQDACARRAATYGKFVRAHRRCFARGGTSLVSLEAGEFACVGAP